MELLLSKNLVLPKSIYINRYFSLPRTVGVVVDEQIGLNLSPSSESFFLMLCVGRSLFHVSSIPQYLVYELAGF